MPNEELSEDCKRRLRDLDGSVAQLIRTLRENDMQNSAALSRGLLPRFDQTASADEPCRQVLRGIDQASSVLSLLSKLDRAPLSSPEVARHTETLEGIRGHIQQILT